MTKVKKSFLSCVMALIITLQTAVSGYAMPAIPIMYGAMALFSAIAVTLGYQTTQINDFKNYYGKLSKTDKDNLKGLSNGSKIALGTALIDMVHNTIYGEVQTNQIITRYQGYNEANTTLPDENTIIPTVSTESVIQQQYDSKPKVIEGYSSIWELCNKLDSDNGNVKYYVSNPIKLKDLEFRYQIAKYNAGFSYLYIQKYTNGQWNNINYYSEDRQGQAFQSYRLLDENYNFLTKLYINPTTYEVGLSYHWYDDYNRVWRVNSNTLANGTVSDANIIEKASIKTKAQKLDVDRTKLINTSYDTSKTYTANDLTYTDTDIKATTLTGIDPVVKTTSSGSGSSAGTGATIDLSGVISGLNDLKIQTNAQSAQQYDFFNWIKTMLTNMYNAILNIPIAIVTALQAVITAIQATTTAIGNLGLNIGTSIAEGLSGLFNSLLTAVQGIASSILSGLQSLFVPDFANLQLKYNNLNNKFRSKLGLFWQASEAIQTLFGQSFEYKEPEITVKLDPPYGDGKTYKVVDFSIFTQYRTQYLIIVNAMVWFTFFRKLATSNPLKGGGKE